MYFIEDFKIVWTLILEEHFLLLVGLNLIKIVSDRWYSKKSLDFPL